MFSWRPARGILVGILITSTALSAQSIPKDQSMSHHATGTFTVSLKPQAAEASSDPLLARMTIDKHFDGDLTGTSIGQMLSAGTAVKGSAGYVAIERFTGTLGGHAGSFTLQHSGIMDRGAPQLTVIIVPDSGTEGLTGITGKLTINIADGKHSYDLDYTLPGPK